MHYKMNISFILIFLFTFLLQAGAFAQATFEGLGHLPGEPGKDVWSSAYGVSSDGLAVVGWSDDDVITKAFRWTILGGMLDLGGLPGGSEDSHARAASEDGSVVVGWSGSDKGGEAFRWTAGGMVGLDDLPGGNFSSDAYDVSSDGSVVVGFSSSANGTAEAFRWTASSGMVGLGDLPGGIFQSLAEGVSADGSVVVGTSWSENGAEAFIWSVSADSMIGLDGLVGGSGSSRAFDVTPDGLIVVGNASGPNNVLELFRWTSAGGMEGLGGSVGPGPYAVSADGSVIVGRLSGSDMNFIYTDADGIRNLKDVLENDYGLDLSDWTLDYARDISDDGTVIVGWGSHPNGIREAWRAVLGGSAITVVSPSAGELWIAGEKDTIKWQSGSIDFVDISYSIDGGKNFNDPIVLNYPADSGKFVWDIPDTLLSRRCVIQINDPSSTFSAQSGLFKIKGYELTRIDENEDYERFTPGEDGWNFANRQVNMWPPGWWNQFDYINGIDPFTSEEYPFVWPFVPIFADSYNFPDWPLFVEAFSIDQSYFNGGSDLVYRPSAIAKWTITKGYYGGACHGFAVSSLLGFIHKDAFISEYGVSGFTNLFDLPIDESTRIAINKAWARQFGELPLDRRSDKWETTPNETLAELKEMFLNELQDEGALVFFEVDPEDNPGGHSVTPIRITKDPNNSDIEFIEVYDNNHPNTSNMFTIDKVANTWVHADGWDGDAHMYIDLPSEVYLQSAVLSPLSNPSVPVVGMNHSNSSEEGGFVELYNPPSLSIFISNSSGSTIGFDISDSSIVNTLPGGIPQIPLTGYPHPPIGYYVPKENFTVQMETFLDSIAYFSIFEDSLSYTYVRSDAIVDQTDIITTGAGIGVVNPDNVSKFINVESIVTEATMEKVMDILNAEMIQDDSLLFTVVDNDEFKFVNYTSGTSYNLRLRLASAMGEDLYEHSKIDIESNSSHRIVADWDDLSNQPVQIYVDLGNDGTIDDTITIKNQITGIDDQGLLGIPDEYYLAQNYPNPFNPVTKIRYSIPQLSNVSLIVYNILGQEVITLVNEQQPAGNYEVSFDATNLTSGIYLYKIQAGGYSDVKKMILLR